MESGKKTIELEEQELNRTADNEQDQKDSIESGAADVVVSGKKSALESLEAITAAPLFWMDDVADRFSDRMHEFWISVATAASKIVSVYRNSRRTIAAALLAVCVLSAMILIVFDRFTVYEYAYNGKMLGYVKAQEEVTNVLAIAGEQLNRVNTDSEQDIEFVANDNISFKRVVSGGKDTDDADTTINKLAFMTDIEVDASGIYDGDQLLTIVKDENSAESLLAEVKTELSRPDEGMELISADFHNAIDIRPINILLTSVQSYYTAKSQMIKGGDATFYHLVEEGETLTSIAETFGVEIGSIYDEDNKAQVGEVSRGDKICIHKQVNPLSVEMVETGRMKEIIPYETVEKKSDKYYIGDKVVSVEGVDGVQIFEGTVTKIGNKVVSRDTDNIEVLTEKVDKVILIGTSERPKTAPTGTFINPLNAGTYVITSRPGWRWGRTHEGVDMGCPVGTKVHATDGGVVVRAGVYGGYGYCIDIDHGNGWISRYGHLNSFKVNVGDKVYQGQYIADSGNSGRSTGAHLHFETRHNGSFVDPDSKVKGGL